MNGEITRYVDASETLSISRPPEQVLAEAKKAADALTKVIAGKKDPVKFNGQIYLEFEDWQTVAKFYGVTVKVESTTPANFGDVRGFEATAVALDREGREVSRAESLCLTDEENWGMRPKYEWQDEIVNGKKVWDDQRKRYKANKVKVADVPTPLFQLKSMAQTRACAKALRQVFAWVVVLAGYKPTVAEEMTGNERELHEEQEQQKPQPEVQRKSEKAKGGFPPVGNTAAAKKEDVICAECRMKNGAHDSICSQHPDKKKAETVPENAGDAYEGPDPGQEEKPEHTASREEQWNNFAGHDEKQHISFKQGGFLFVMQGKTGITDDQMKEYLKKNLNVDHRPLILKKDFTALIDAIDPEFKYHVAKK
jgi:hypothetical protein